MLYSFSIFFYKIVKLAIETATFKLGLFMAFGVYDGKVAMIISGVCGDGYKIFFGICTWFYIYFLLVTTNNGGLSSGNI